MEILISGMTCSGKTTLSNKILERFNDVSILRQDDYFKNRKDIPRDKNDFFLYDNPYAFDISLFVTDVYRLLHDGYVYSPIYDVRSNTRTNERRKINRSEINVFEYVEDYSIDNEQKLYDMIKLVSLLHNKTSFYKGRKRIGRRKLFSNQLFTWAIVDKYDPNQNVTLSASSDNVRIGFQTTF